MQRPTPQEAPIATLLPQLIRLGVASGLLLMMLAQGLSITREDFGYLRRRPRLAMRALLAVVVLVPLATLVLVGLLRPAPAVAVGLALLAAAPAAPFALPNVLMAGGRREFVVPLHLLLAGLSLITVPLVLSVMAHALGFRATIAVGAVLGQVALGFVLPLGVGIALRAWRPALAQRLEAPVRKTGFWLMVAAVVLLLPFVWQYLLALNARSYLTIALTVAVALAIGHWLITTDPAGRTVGALECACRHPGLMLLIATHNFPEAKPAAVLIPYLAIFLLLSGFYKRAVRTRRSLPITR